MDDDASPAYKEGAPGEEGQEAQHPSTRIPSHPASPVAAGNSNEACLPRKSVDPEMDTGSVSVHASPSSPGAANVYEPSTAANESEPQQEDSSSKPPLGNLHT